MPGAFVYLAFAARRVATTVLVAVVVTVLCFALMHAVPGGPFDGARALSAPVRANLERRYGLGAGPVVQFTRYVAGLARGDLGDSLSQRDRSVAELLAVGAPLTLAVGSVALLVCVAGGIALGLAAALGRPAARTIASGAIALGLAVPTFVLAPALALGVGLWLRWLPVGGHAPGEWRDLVLPVLALAWLPLCEVARLTQGGIAAVAGAPYVEAARLRGVAARTVLLHYVLVPALRPVVGYLGPLAAGVLAGSLVVERLYGLPGMGSYLIEGALARDYPLVMGATLVYLALLALLNLLAELLGGALDPELARRLAGA